MFFAGGIGQIPHDDNHREENGKTFFQRSRGKQRGPDAVQGKRNDNAADYDRGRSLPDTGVGLAVIFPHDILDILFRTGTGVLTVNVRHV